MLYFKSVKMFNLNLKIGKKGFGLVENLVGIFILCILITEIFGVYYVLAASVSRGSRMAAANSALRSYIAREVAAGYAGGAEDVDNPGNDGSRYITMPKSKSGSDAVTLGDVVGTITCNPWYPNNIQTALGDQLMFENVRYKIAGFTVSWIDKTPIGRQDIPLSVSSAVIICEHD